MDGFLLALASIWAAATDTSSPGAMIFGWAMLLVLTAGLITIPYSIGEMLWDRWSRR